MATRLGRIILFCFAITLHLAAQQTEPDRRPLEEIKASAEKGDLSAQVTLGFGYLFGNDYKQDYNEAAKWLRLAAENSHAVAAHNLGYMYGNGLGVKTNLAEALRWYRKAAEQGFAGSEFEVGAYYASGTVVAQDYLEAVKWLKRAAEKGDARAQNNLGTLYHEGKGVPQDYVEAYKWYNLAAAQGIGDSDYNRKLISAYMTAEQIADAQRLTREFKPRQNRGVGSLTSKSDPSQPLASGTGFFISEDGYLISNNHVVKGANQIRLVTSAGLISAQVVKVDAANDLALLKAEGRFAPLPLSPSRGVKLGGTVATVGFPNIGLQGFAPKLAKGEIASLSGAGDDARYFQISVPVQPGNSGGALVDERGNVVGVVSAKLNASAALAMSGTLPENVNYAVKSSYLLSFLEVFADGQLKLKEPSTKEKKFEEVVKEAEQAAVLVLVY